MNPSTTPHHGEGLAAKDAGHAHARRIKDIAANNAAIAARLSAPTPPGEKLIFAHAKHISKNIAKRKAGEHGQHGVKSAGQKTAASDYVSTKALRAANAELESVLQDRLRVWHAAHPQDAASDESIEKTCNEAANAETNAAHAQHATKAKFIETARNAVNTADAYML